MHIFLNRQFFTQATIRACSRPSRRGPYPLRTIERGERDWRARRLGSDGRTDGRAERGLPRFGRFFKGGETGRVRRRNPPRHDRLSLKERGGEGFDAAAAEAEAADFAFASAAAAVGPAGLGSGIAKRAGLLVGQI